MWRATSHLCEPMVIMWDCILLPTLGKENTEFPSGVETGCLHWHLALVLEQPLMDKPEIFFLEIFSSLVGKIHKTFVCQHFFPCW